MFSYLRTLTTWHCPLPLLQQSIDTLRAHSSKPASRCCSGQMGQTKGRTDGRTDTVSFRRPLCGHAVLVVSETAKINKTCLTEQTPRQKFCADISTPRWKKLNAVKLGEETKKENYGQVVIINYTTKLTSLTILQKLHTCCWLRSVRRLPAFIMPSTPTTVTPRLLVYQSSAHVFYGNNLYFTTNGSTQQYKVKKKTNKLN